jgi:transmembrane sensor
MSEYQDKINDLIRKELLGRITDEEREELRGLTGQSETETRWHEEIVDEENIVSNMYFFGQAEARSESARGRVLQGVRGRWARIIPIRGSYGAVAASVALLITAGSIIWLLAHRSGTKLVPPVAMQQDLLPGGNRAILTLANGSKIILDSAANGALATQGGAEVVKLDSGEIAYKSAGSAAGPLLYNTIATPRGGQYKIVLPDGSRVWLNAATTLRVPAAFTGTDRSVELEEGEAYFEVKPTAGRSFTVHVDPHRPGDKEMDVEVLGTSFNLNAYGDEPEVLTTLLTGSLRVTKGSANVVLYPGEQASVVPGLDAVHVGADVDAAGTIAWKDGLFHFDRVGTEEVMRQLARWYDVDVIYEGSLPVRQFVGTIPRDVPASDVLKALELNKVHFRIEGKKIIVQP